VAGLGSIRIDGRDRRGLRNVQRSRFVPAARAGGDMEQRVVLAVSIRRDQLHEELGLRRLRRRWVLDRCVSVDDAVTATPVAMTRKAEQRRDFWRMVVVVVSLVLLLLWIVLRVYQ
jgi:hypothetical protein